MRSRWCLATVLVFLLAALTTLTAPCGAEEFSSSYASADVIIRILLPPCPSNVTGRLLHQQRDSQGNILRIWCNRQYQMEIIRKDGKRGWIGKCPFPWGHNIIAKKVRALIVRMPDGRRVIKLVEMRYTFWKSVGPVGDPPTGGEQGPVGEGKDRIWKYDVRRHEYIRQETKHRGRWVKEGGKWRWRVDQQWKVGSPTKPAPPPQKPGLLFVQGDVSIEELEEAYTHVPPYEAITPIPVTMTDQEGRIETYVYTQLPGAEYLKEERIEARVGEPFEFDIDFPGEDELLIRYSLVHGPAEMELDPNTGVLCWVPGETQVGYHLVVIETDFAGLGTEVDSFLLPVVNAP